MISNLETKSSKKVSEELTHIFNSSISEIEVLANQAPNQIVESVHLIRKRLKFLRAFVKLTRFCSDELSYKPVNYILRDCGQTLSDCRDAHVRGLLLDEYGQKETLQEVIQELTESNKKITQSLEKDLLKNPVLFDELTSDLTQNEVKKYIQSLEPDSKCLTDGLSLGYEKSYHAFHSELKSHEADLLHEWRKRTKDLQYQLEVLLESIPNHISPSYEEVAALCEILGRINDLFMFIEWLNVQKSVNAEKPLTALKEELKQKLKNLEEEADEMGNSLFTLTPEEYNEELCVHLEA